MRTNVGEFTLTVILVRALKRTSRIFALLVLIGLGFLLFEVNARWIKLPPEQAILGYYESKDIGDAKTFLRLSEFPKHVPMAVLAAEGSNYLIDGSAWGACMGRAIESLLVNGTVPLRTKCGYKFPNIVVNGRLPMHSPLRRTLSMMLFVRKMESVLSRKQIFELVLNKAYFGKGAYGVSEGAASYFGKSIDQLTIAEAATLGGILKAPAKYDPIRNPFGTKRRRHFVLLQMLKRDMISRTEYEAALAEPLALDMF